MNPLKLTCQVFHLLTVLGRADNSATGKTRWICRCRCGNQTIVQAYELTSGKTKSCGCLKRSAKKHGHGRRTGASPEYYSWQSMIHRCTNPNNKAYRHYGGRGITVDPSWRDFRNFLSDMGPRPSLDHSLERKYNELGYSKENCTWALQTQQMRNTRRSVFVLLNGESLCLKDACLSAGIPVRSVNATRQFKHLTPQEAFDYHRLLRS